MNRVSVHFKWFDLWVGVFIERNDPNHDGWVLYICPLPMLVVKVLA